MNKKIVIFFVMFSIFLLITLSFIFLNHNNISFFVKNDYLVNNKNDILKFLKKKIDDENIDNSDFVLVEPNDIAKESGYLIYEAKINSDIIIQTIEKNGHIEAIRIYSFNVVDNNESVKKIFEYLVEGIETSSNELQKIKMQINNNFKSLKEDSTKFIITGNTTSYYIEGKIIFNKNNLDLLNNCNSFETTNIIYENKQNEIEFLANYTFEQVEKIINAENPTIDYLNSAKLNLDSLNKKIEEIKNEDNFENKYVKVVDNIETWNFKIQSYRNSIFDKLSIDLPDFSNMNQEEAKNWGDANNINVTISTEYSTIVANGRMISQSVDANTKVEKGKDKVTLVYSQGRKPTIEDSNALKKAQSYSDNFHMSKQGIYEQLISSYGEGFTVEAAQYAIEHINADWNYNALQKAKSYQKNLSMSRNSIYEQLVSNYGEKFTESEAQYAIDHLDN